MTLTMPTSDSYVDDQALALTILGNNPHINRVCFYSDTLYDGMPYKDETHSFSQGDKEKTLDEMIALWSSEYIPF